METEKCKHCGALLSEKAKFCFECGTLIGRNKQDDDVPIITSLKVENGSESQSELSAENELLNNKQEILKDDETTPNIIEKDNNNTQKNGELLHYNNSPTQQNYQQGNHYSQNQNTGFNSQFNPYITPPPSDSKYASMSMWSYVGIMLLFSLPIIGFILAIIWACDSNNINRRNYARAVLVVLALTIILSIVITVIGIVLLYDIVKELIESIPQDGMTIPFNPFDQYDIKIDGLIFGIKNKSGAFNYRNIGDIFAV